MCKLSTSKPKSTPRVLAHRSVTRIDDTYCSEYALNYEDIPDYVDTSSYSSSSSILPSESITKSYYLKESYIINESIHNYNPSSFISRPRRETQRSRTIPIPSSHIKRTKSEIQLSKDFEAKDFQMFNRLLLAGLSQHNSMNPDHQKVATGRITKSRTADILSLTQDQYRLNICSDTATTISNSSFTNLSTYEEKNDESNNEYAKLFYDDCIFEMDL